MTIQKRYRRRSLLRGAPLRRLLLAAMILVATLAVPATASADPLCFRSGYYTKGENAYFLNCNHHAILGTTLIATGVDSSNVCVSGKRKEYLGSTNPARNTTGWVQGFRVDRILDGSYCTYW